MKKVFYQGIIFIIYLILSSLFLFNHNGGADIITMAFMVILPGIHCIFLIAYAIKWQHIDQIRNKYLYSLLLIVSLTIMFHLFSQQYLLFMWEMTN
ncbi:MAG: hypothetical protein H6586_05480 [Flavobacteriales bacterium]|nr:hypothetical protein [Flavobacteriales bacterium]